MIEYIKEYGITSIDYEYILNNVPMDVIENIALCEDMIRETLKFYNDLGITNGIASLIVNRPDLVIINKESLEELVNKIDKNVFVNLVNKSADSLIVLGI